MKKITTPHQSVKDNLLLTKTGKCWAYYQVPPLTISDSDEEKLETYKGQLENVFLSMGTFPEFKMQLIPTDFRLRERFEELAKDFADGQEKKGYNPLKDYRELGKKYIDRTIKLLTEELGEITEYTMYLAVRLKPSFQLDDESLKKNIKHGASHVKSNLYSLLNIEIETDEEEFNRYINAEEELFYTLQTIACERISKERLQFLHQFAFYRGQPQRQAYDPSECVIDPSERAGYLKMITDDEESYVALLPIAETREMINYLELFPIAEDFPFPVEFHINGRAMLKTIIGNKINFVSNRFKETDKDMFQNEDEDDEIVQGKQLLNDLRNKVNNQNIPVYEWLACYVVAGKTLGETKEKARQVKNMMRDQHKVTVVQPVADQLFLFYKFLQGQSLELTEPYWVQYTTNAELAEFCIGLTKQLGSYLGWYLGRITDGEVLSREDAVANSRMIALFHSFLAHEGIEGATTDSPHIAILGSTGNGKSYLVKILFFYLIFMEGKVLLTDPKSEFRERIRNATENEEVQKNYPEFVEFISRIKFIRLDPDKEGNHGVLDPLNFLTGSKARDTIFDIFNSIMTLNDQRTENELRRVVETVLRQKENGEQVGLMTAVDILEQSEDKTIHLFGENLKLKIENSILQLAFGYGKNTGVSIQDKATILEIEGLDLPDSKMKTSEQSETEQKSVAVMIALAKFCEEFGKRSKHEKTTIIFDEAWTLTTAKGGKKLVKSLRRVGRSYANQLILVTQSVDDIQNEDDSGNFGACFFFDESSEREKILQTAGLPVTKENIDMLKQLKKGQCIFKDFYGRTDELSVDCLFPEWDLAFQTTDKSNAGQAERQFAR